MKLIDVKDTLPVGFIPIQETVDTRESALSMLALGAAPFFIQWAFKSSVHVSLEICEGASCRG